MIVRALLQETHLNTPTMTDAALELTPLPEATTCDLHCGAEHDSFQLAPFLYLYIFHIIL